MMSIMYLSCYVSHPTWVRGLKQSLVAVMVKQAKSHPTWVRGLKHGYTTILDLSVLSHPTWVRGLKLPDTQFGAVSLCRTLRGCVD